jgi:hypothetical protein
MSPAMLKSAIENGGIKTRADAGREYAIIIAVYVQRGETDSDNNAIGELNGAIVARWSARGLDWIKKTGWSIYAQSERPEGSIKCAIPGCSCGGELTPRPCPAAGFTKS